MGMDGPTPSANSHPPWLPGPFQPPNWRWLRARWLYERGKRPARNIDDGWVARAWNYLTAIDRCTQDDASTQRLDAALREAHWLYNRPGAREVWRLEAFLLTDEPAEAVAVRLGLPARTVRAYERLFYCVRDHAAAPDWIVKHVLGPGIWVGFGEHEIGRLWRAFAYFGGSEVLEIVTDVTTAGGRQCRPDLLGASPPQGHEGRIRERARMAVAAMMLPADTSEKPLAAVYARTRRYEQRREYKHVSARVAEAAARLLDSAETPQPRTRPDRTATRAVA